MMRKAALDLVGGYTTDPARQPPEDYELWSRIARRFRVANLPERLTVYREVPSSMSRAGIDPFKRKLVRLSAEIWQRQPACRSRSKFMSISLRLSTIFPMHCRRSLISLGCATPCRPPAGQLAVRNRANSTRGSQDGKCSCNIGC